VTTPRWRSTDEYEEAAHDDVARRVAGHIDEEHRRMPMTRKLWPRPTRPRTVIGMWIRAFLLRDEDLSEQLNGQLNGGKKGWNRDEAGVMQAVCVLAANVYFAPGYDVRAITEVASRIRAADQYGGRTAHGQLEIEAVIRHALGDKDVDVSGISAYVAYQLQGVVAAIIAWETGFTETEIDELITEAERMAFARGWNPPFAL
jgi:hypothetical protein